MNACVRTIMFMSPVAVLACGIAHADAPLPSYYQAPGISPGRSTVNHNNDEHIDPFTGMLQLHHVDATLPGNGGFDLTLQRSYNSPSPLFGTSSDTISFNRTPNVGIGWNLLIGGRLLLGPNACGGGQQIMFETPDGGRQALMASGNGDFLSTARWRALCVAGGVQVYAPNGTRYDMTQPIAEFIPGTAGNQTFLYPAKITDRNGNYASFAYVVNGVTTLLDSVVTSDGRTISFAYGTSDADHGKTGALLLLAEVTTSGRTWQFIYATRPTATDVNGVGTAYELAGVIDPVGATWTYTYNACKGLIAGSCAISGFKYPEGGTINYTYAFVDFHDTRGNASVIKTKTTGGYSGLSGLVNNSWQYNYTPGSPGINDVTTVTTPLGTITYEHVGFNTVGQGSYWSVGLLMKKTEHDTGLGDIQTDMYTWDKQQISPVATYRGYAVSDGATYAPLMTQHKITMGGNSYSTIYSNFDVYGNAQTAVEQGERTHTVQRTYFTDASKWIVNLLANESISGTGNIERHFDTQGNLKSEIRFGVSKSFDYAPADGSLIGTTDSNGNVVRFSDYFRGVARTEQRPEGVATMRTVDDAGNVTSQTDGAGHLYQYAYDKARRLTGQTPPLGNPTTIDWSADNTVRTATRGAYVDSLTLDGLGNPRLSTKAGINFAYAHDALNRQIFESLPGQVIAGDAGHYTVFGTLLARDSIGRVMKVTNSDGSFRSMVNGANSQTIKDENLAPTVNHYNAFGDPSKRFLVSVDLPTGERRQTMGKDDLGNLTSITQGTPAAGTAVTRAYRYSPEYFLVAIDDPETGTTTFERDAVGNMTSRTVAGRKTTYAYDGLNRLKTVAYPNGDSAVISYFLNGKTQSIVGTHATLGYTYDDNANLSSETLTVGAQTFTVNYTYDGNDALASITYPRTASMVSYQPDPLGRPTAAIPYVSAIAYFDSGNLKQMRYASGVNMSYDENVRQWPMLMKGGAGGQTPDILGKSYGYDHAGNLTQAVDSVDPLQSLYMTYNPMNEFSQAAGPWGMAELATDAVGNVTYYRVGPAENAYFYTSDNKLASFNRSSFTYDGYGNVTGDGAHAYRYDDASNMVCVDCGTAAEIQYLYDGNNRRVARTTAGTTTYYVTSSRGDLLIEYTPAKGQLVEHIYVHGKRIASRNVQQ